MSLLSSFSCRKHRVSFLFQILYWTTISDSSKWTLYCVHFLLKTLNLIDFIGFLLDNKRFEMQCLTTFRKKEKEKEKNGDKI